MTAATSQSLATAFAEHRDTFGVPITFGINTIVAIVAEVEAGRDLMNGGYAETGDLSCKLLVTELPTPPVFGDPANYSGRNYRVQSVSQQPGSKIMECNMRPAKR